VARLEACRACLYVECLHLPFAVDKPRCHKFTTPQLSSDLDPVERVWPAACRWHSHFAGTRKDRIAAKRRSAKMEGNNITQQIMAIQRDPNLTDVEKAKKRQELLSGKWARPLESATGALLRTQLCVHSSLQHLQLIFSNLCARLARCSSYNPSAACHVR